MVPASPWRAKPSRCPTVKNNRIQLSARRQHARDGQGRRGLRRLLAARRAGHWKPRRRRRRDIRARSQMTTTELRRHAGCRGSRTGSRRASSCTSRFALPLACITAGPGRHPAGRFLAQRRANPPATSGACSWRSSATPGPHQPGGPRQAAHHVRPKRRCGRPTRHSRSAGLFCSSAMAGPPGRPRPARRSVAAGSRTLIGALGARASPKPAPASPRRFAIRPPAPASADRRHLHPLQLPVLFRCCCWPASCCMTQIFNFFELLGDIVRNNIPLVAGLHLPVLPDARS